MWPSNPAGAPHTYGGHGHPGRQQAQRGRRAGRLERDRINLGDGSVDGLGDGSHWLWFGLWSFRSVVEI